MQSLIHFLDHGTFSGEWEPPTSDGRSMAAFHVREALAVVYSLRVRQRAEHHTPVAPLLTAETRQAVALFSPWRDASRSGYSIPLHDTLLQGRSQESLQTG